MKYFNTATIICLLLLSNPVNINAQPTKKKLTKKSTELISKAPLKPLPININDFKKIILGKYFYVDKTRAIHNLYRGEKQHFYFLTRPQGFGKTTLLSTIKAYFGNDASLLEGLYVAKRKRWKEMSPKSVITLDFSTIPHRTSAEEFKEFLAESLDTITEELNCNTSKSKSPILKMRNLVNKLYGRKKRKVVILIDNYDTPIMVKSSHQKAIYQQLKDFYSALHGLEDKIEFLFITGLCNFWEKDLLAQLNLINLSHDERSKKLIGFSQKELAKNFTPYVNEFAQSSKMTAIDVLKKLETWYGGYDFTTQDDETEYVANPKSILKALSQSSYSSFFEKSSLYGLLSDAEKDSESKRLIAKITSDEPCEIDSMSLDLHPETSLGQDLRVIPVLHQLGIIAAQQLSLKPPRYNLTCPNKEARNILKDKEILKLMTPELSTAINENFLAVKEAIANHNPELLISTINKIIFAIPSKIRIAKEAYFQSIIHIILMGLDLSPNSEYTSGEGVADTVLYTDEMDYIFEYKLNKKSIHGFKQIYDRRYANGFAHRNKPITCIAMSFYWKGDDSTEKTTPPLRISYRIGYIDVDGNCIDPHELITYKSIDDFKKYCLDHPKNQKTPTKRAKTFADAQKEALQKSDADMEAELMGWKKTGLQSSKAIVFK
ncbi:AAA family ATPase [Candidatus Dependentiae bacterium]|jgi:hypothetical protein|nr:AAA family ATPase [Candidatus Dependentiae bacterium]